ncbi:MAG: hypothetical protein ABIP93_14835 [Gemmatimonadaceae bacterium]
MTSRSAERYARRSEVAPTAYMIASSVLQTSHAPHNAASQGAAQASSRANARSLILMEAEMAPHHREAGCAAGRTPTTTSALMVTDVDGAVADPSATDRALRTYAAAPGPRLELRKAPVAITLTEASIPANQTHRVAHLPPRRLASSNHAAAMSSAPASVA